MKWAKSKGEFKFINMGSKMCGQEIKVYSFLNLNFIRKKKAEPGGSRGEGEASKVDRAKESLRTEEGFMVEEGKS